MLAILAMCCSRLAFGVDVLQLSGIITEQAYQINNAPPHRIVSAFDVIVCNGRWRITTTFGPDWYESYVYDGTNTYGMLHSPDSKNSVAGLPDSGSIWPEDYPVAAFCSTRVVWLALASGDFISQATNDFMPAPWLGGFTDAARCYRYTAIMNKSNQFFPLYVEFIGSTNWSAKNAGITGSGQRDMMKSSPVVEGFVGGEYHMLKETNFNGELIPLEFEVKRYRPKTNDVLESFQGIVTNVSRGDQKEDYSLAIARKTSVIDYRFVDSRRPGMSVRFNLEKTNIWPTNNDPYLLKQAEFEKGHYDKVMKKTSINQTSKKQFKILRYIILIGMLFPVLIVLKHLRIKTKQIDNKQKMKI